MKKKLNDAAKTYGQMQGDWKVGKKSDLEAFSKGASESGTSDVAKGFSRIGSKLKRAWGELKK